MPAETTPIVYTISGTIYDQFDNPLPNVLVRLFDKDFRSEQLLGEKMTDARGRYMIEFNSERGENPEYERVDVFIKLTDAAGVSKGQSPIYFNIKENIIIDYKIGDTAYRGGSEFDNLLKKIRPVVEPQEVPLGKLEENGRHKDISFLANELGENEQHISFINTAFNLSYQTPMTSNISVTTPVHSAFVIAPDIFYALLRLGFPNELKQLLLIKSESIIKALKQAIDQNIISAKWSADLEEVIKILNALAAKDILEGDATNPSVFKKLMGTALSADQQKVFLDTYLATESQPEKFWEQLKLQPAFSDENTVEKAKRVLNLNLLTAHQPELTNLLFTLQETDPELKEMRGFAKFGRAEWKELIANAGTLLFPAHITGNTKEEKVDNYASSLEKINKELHPTTFFSSRMKADAYSSFTTKSELVSFFERNPDFNLKTNELHKEMERADFIALPEEAKKEIKRLNRLVKLSDDYAVVNALNSERLDSATAIVTKYGEKEFIAKFATPAGGEMNATAIYNRSITVDKRTTALLINYKMRHDIPTYVMHQTFDVPEGYHEMFGDGELCECEHCQSVYSPSAYLVDMLTFMNNKNTNAYNELIRRRPDLDDILLTCKNTNTPVPYIDLVNELLEKQVIRRSATNDTEGITAATHSYQTEGEQTELAAIPEHSSVVVNEPLKKISDHSVFVSQLPYDLYAEQIKSFTQKLGYNRNELLATFYEKAQAGLLNDSLVAAECFSISTAELNLINGMQVLNVSMPGTVREFLDLTNLNFKELLQLLESYFLNPTRQIKIEQIIANPNPLQPDFFSCDLDQLKITGADNAWIHKTARFLRLWRKTGWDFFDVDRALVSFLKKQGQTTAEFPSTADFNPLLLVPLWHIEKLSKTLNISRRDTLTLVTDIDTAGYVDQLKEGRPAVLSLYTTLFRSKAVTSLQPAAPFTDKPEDLTGTIADHTEVLSAIFKVPISDLNVLYENNATISLASLSSLYRDILLAKSLGIPVKELKHFFAYSNNKAVNRIWSMPVLFAFLEEVALLNSFSIAGDKVKELLMKKIGADYKIPVSQLLIHATQHISSLENLQNDTTISEPNKKEQYKQQLVSFTTEIENNQALVNALSVGLTEKDDVNVKEAIEGFRGPTNLQVLESLSIGECISKMKQFSSLLSDYLLLKETPLLFKHVGFSVEVIRWLTDNKVKLGIDSLLEQTLNVNDNAVRDSFINLLHIAKLDKTKDAKEWKYLIERLLIGDSKERFYEAVSERTKFSDEVLNFLGGLKSDMNSKGKLQMNFPDDYYNGKKLLQFLQCGKIADSLKANTAQLTALTDANFASNDFKYAQSVKNLLKSSYSNAEWLEIVKPLNDGFRTRRRDALIAWLVSNPDNSQANASAPPYSSAADIYKSILIDCEMDSCMITSRIKQAISSVQLFIDRCLLNLETGILMDKDFTDQWHAWRKQYRFWEADRKIFLYPENWIEPELRDDKSVFFKELESQLKQDEVTEETAKEALLSYLHKLDAVANLEVIGHFNDEETKVLHVIGRTETTPHQYYYRRLEKGQWKPWEKVDTDIEGDHCLPVVWNGRLYLFWTLIIEKQEDNAGFDVPASGETIPPPQNYLDVKLLWSEYKKSKWSGKKISKTKFSTLDFNLGGHIYRDNHIALNSTIDNGDLVISIYVPHWTIAENQTKYEFIYKIGAFVFDACNSSPATPYVNAGMEFWKSLQRLTKVEHNKMQVFENESNDVFSIFDSGVYKTMSGSNEKTVFRNTPGKFKVTPGHHNIAGEGEVRFFYANNKNNFYVRSTDTINVINAAGPAVNVVSPAVIGRRAVMSFATANDAGNGNGRTIMARRIREGLPEINPNLMDEVNTVLDPYHEYKGRQFIFQPFYHPFVCSYIKMVTKDGIDAMYDPNVQGKPSSLIFSSTVYNPTQLVTSPLPEEEVDFSYAGSYSCYNWELFYHIPMLMASRLSQNQQYDDARKWFHYVFNPTKYTNGTAGAENFWIVKPFKKEIRQTVTPLEQLLLNDNYKAEVSQQITNWEQNPFNPHAVARMRVSAYMRNTMLKYIDNLIQWGDQLFMKDTIESINEATQYYILAGEILGKKLDIVPGPKAAPKSFVDIKGNLDRFSNYKAELETFIGANGHFAADDNLRIPYFGIPKNDHMLKYWDTIADRLFKIRHCMNITGTVRSLALFEPAIDPGMLVKAKAAGLDLSKLMMDSDSLLPYYRFAVMLQKANELCNDVKALGSNFLSVLEKKDAESLAMLRSEHELKMLDMIKGIKEKQRDEAKESLTSLQHSLANVQERKNFYSTREYRNAEEEAYFNLTINSNRIQTVLEINSALAAIGYLIPNFNLGPWIVGSSTGGINIGNATQAAMEGGQALAAAMKTGGELANMKGIYKRRKEDWDFQAKTAELEIKQIEKQIAAGEIRLAMAEKEIENHDLQKEQSWQVREYMQDKFTNEELYDWMKAELFDMYRKVYNLAYTIAKKAEKCMNYELGTTHSIIQMDNWDSFKKGLLSGDKLQHDLRKLELTYIDNNVRELEITKHISLAQLNALEIVKLRTTGQCKISLPEELFDLDFPGHYFRRIKSVSLSIPCIAGPYTSINATLKLDKNEYRAMAVSTNGDYARSDDEKRPNWGIGKFRSVANPSVAIAMSTAQNDSGVFELNFRDERYLPFEGSGVISEWVLDLNNDYRQFDYYTISDVIVHLRYTARNETKTLDIKTKVNENIAKYFAEIDAGTDNLFARVFSLKNEFPNAFYQLLNSVPQKTSIAISNNHFNWVFASRKIKAKKIDVILIYKRRDNGQNTPDDPAEFKFNAIAASSWQDSSESGGRKSSFNVNNPFDPRTQIPIEAGSGNGDDGLNKDELEDILICLKFNIS